MLTGCLTGVLAGGLVGGLVGWLAGRFALSVTFYVCENIEQAVLRTESESGLFLFVE